MTAVVIGISTLVAIVAAAIYGRVGANMQAPLLAVDHKPGTEPRNRYTVHPGNLRPVAVPMPSLN